MLRVAVLYAPSLLRVALFYAPSLLRVAFLHAPSSRAAILGTVEWTRAMPVPMTSAIQTCHIQCKVLPIKLGKTLPSTPVMTELHRQLCLEAAWSRAQYQLDRQQHQEYMAMMAKMGF